MSASVLNWKIKQVDKWLPPGRYRSANRVNGEYIWSWYTEWRSQVFGIRDDGKAFFVNAVADGDSTESERDEIVKRAELELDGYLGVDV